MNGDGYGRDSGRSGGNRGYGSRDDRRRDGGRDDRDRGRRHRSRSPRHNRRDYEVDTYSSSRDYREREREDTYARRERRDDRAWGDSYSRRDRPRDRDEREDHRGGGGHRRDRDRGGFEDDRRGGGRRDGGMGGFGGGRDRAKRSATPPFKKREPTPDLSGFTSILVRPRRMTQWDIKPGNYENITAEQAKLSGMFPLPGAPRAAPMDPSKLAAFVNPTTGTANASVLEPANAKQAKLLFLHNLPDNTNADEIKNFFNLQLNGLNVVSGNDPCLNVNVARNGESASIEFRTAEDATVALAMDGITMRDVGAGAPDREGLSIRRPKDYITPSVNESGASGDVISTEVKDSPNKLSIVNIPTYVEEDQVRELVETFGKLKAFVLVKDTGTEQHRGIAFCEYDDPDIVDAVIEGLNTIPLGDGNLKVTRATVGVQQQVGFDGGVGAISMLAGSSATDDRQASRVVLLANLVTPDELFNDEEYEEIKEDISDECEKYGHILEIKIPRPAGVRTTLGVGKVYIKYEDVDAAQKAIKALAGRQFSRRTVVASDFNEERFDVEAW